MKAWVMSTLQKRNFPEVLFFFKVMNWSRNKEKHVFHYSSEGAQSSV